MNELQPSDFREFFLGLHGKSPFPWQENLAKHVCSEGWPEVIDLPTASGKTACIDVALFALAYRGGEAPRRIFFVVDRRVIVSEAYERVKKIKERLKEPEGEVLKRTAARLRDIAGESEGCPLEAYELRGGAYRDESWVKSPLQPIVVASTVDQVGSRLLFRGYGVSENTAPIHAGLIANDALIFLDEAHCSNAFAETLEAIERYRGEGWAETPIGRPFHFVEMTATPSRKSARPFRMTNKDREEEVLRERIYARKPTRLIEIKGKKDDFGKLADALVEEALRLAEEADATRVAVMVNRIRTARLVHERFQKKLGPESGELVIGRMRPIDRDDVWKRLEHLKSGVTRDSGSRRTFVVSTQCLEVGADLDFDVLVSECASIDALLQRFGRLDRMGDFKRAMGSIVIGSWQTDSKKPDAVYGEALAKTWEWLKSIGGSGGEINMGIEAADGEAATVAQQSKNLPPEGFTLISTHSPVLLPMHVDAFVQTSPTPQPDPEVELFLHGPERGVPDVQVVWRADLPEEDPHAWADIVALCPPVSREAMPVQISTFKRWFAGESTPDIRESDLESAYNDLEHSDQDSRRPALVWRGEDSKHTPIVRKASDIRPGDTIVLPTAYGGWETFGHIPDGVPKDRGDEAAFTMRRTVCLRLHPDVIREWPETQSRKPVEDCVMQAECDEEHLRELLAKYCKELGPEGKRWPFTFLDGIGKLRRVKLDAYPSGPGYLFEGRKSATSGHRDEPVFLDDHLRHVEEAVERIAKNVLDSELVKALRLTAEFHDFGKADLRYQAWLFGGDRMAAQYAPKPRAKSGLIRLGKQEASGLPRGFRHELVSLMFAAKSIGSGAGRDLALHLIASHHGRCRPFAPVVRDDNPECVSYADVSICRQERIEDTPHRLHSQVADRFWKLTRQYGWWGLAYLEALFRLADWKASDDENAEVSD